jgi:hypothetical protein
LNDSETHIDIQLEGDNFYPSRLLEKSKLQLEILAEKGGISKSGRYKGKISPYGLALIPIPLERFEFDLNKALGFYLQMLLQLRPSLDESGVENVTVSLDIPISLEKELSINPIISRYLFELDAKIQIHTYDESRRDLLVS